MYWLLLYYIIYYNKYKCNQNEYISLNLLYVHLNPFICMKFLHTNEMTSTIIVDKVYKESKDNLEEVLISVRFVSLTVRTD